MIHTNAQSTLANKTAGFVTQNAAAINKLMLVVITGLFIGLRAWNLVEYSLWGGETFILDGIHQPWPQMFAYIVRDVVHPPLFYILVKVWIGVFGESLLSMKLIPFLAGIATIIPFLLLCRELNLRAGVVNLALFLIAVNGFLIHYAQEFRMYSLFALFSVFSLWLFVRYWKAEARQRSALFWLFLINLLMVYTHYYGWLVIGMEFIFTALWNRKKFWPFTASALLIFILFSPWLYYVINSAIQKGGLAPNVDWIARPTIFRLRYFYSSFTGQLPFSGNMEIGMLLFAIPVLLWGWNVLRKQASREDALIFWSLALLVTFPVLAVFAVSRLLYLSFWVDRYFIFVAVPFLLLVSIAVFRIRAKWLKWGLISLILAWGVLAGFSDLITNRMAWHSPQLGSRVHWEALTYRLAQQETSTSRGIPLYALTVMSNYQRTGDWAVMTSIPFYLDTMKDSRFDVKYSLDAPSLLPEAEDYFWVASFVLAQEDPGALPRYFARNGFTVGETIEEQYRDNWLILFPVRRE